ncbi:phosphatidylinositol transfer protein alpha isoform-like [Oppia nitens]|uniref:phosphatidylinositol transfer protein alpha isoform-like n=1 Tax=Oppia nitens TaxID=1686743 RepID=UPI0023DB970C|nr:phosphatidylinositol transfer protein alpha isoform-like [Oppia nitens]
MLIKEFRVVLPLTVEEYQIGQLYSVAEASKNETGGGEGVEVLNNEPFDNYPLLGGKFSSGQYTKKIYHLASKVPAMVKMLAPKGSLEVHEEAWNAYPYCKTVITNPDYMKDKFRITIETMHSPDRGNQENAHQLSPEKLKQREVVFINIANDNIPTNDYKASEDPSVISSEKTGRGPLITPNWADTIEPVMCAYKLVTVEFIWFGLQTTVESFMQKTYRGIFLNFHRQVFCWLDRWHGLTMADIRELEEKTKRELDEQRNQGTVRGTQNQD